jgi:hypothetical protein
MVMAVLFYAQCPGCGQRSGFEDYSNADTLRFGASQVAYGLAHPFKRLFSDTPFATEGGTCRQCGVLAVKCPHCRRLNRLDVGDIECIRCHHKFRV